MLMRDMNKEEHVKNNANAESRATDAMEPTHTRSAKKIAQFILPSNGFTLSLHKIGCGSAI